MATIFGLAVNQIHPNPDFRPAQSENGGVTASQTFTMRTQSWNNSTIRNKFVRGVGIATINPSGDPQWDYLTVASVSLDFQEGDLLVASVEFTGSSSAQYGGPDDGLGADSPPTYRLEGRLTDRSFAEHPKWKALSDSEKFALGLLANGDAVAKPDFTGVGKYNDDGEWAAWEDGSGPIALTGNAVEFAKRIAQGENSYFVPSITWTETTQGNTGMTAGQLNKLGRISSPRGGPPTPSGSRNWMLTGASQEQRGGLFQTQIEWSLSERDGHDSFLYDT